MESMFIRNGYICRCDFEVDNSVDPCFVYVTLKDEDLIRQFGVEIAIKTNFVELLPYEETETSLNELRQCIFSGLRYRPEIELARLKLENHQLGRTHVELLSLLNEA